MRRSVASLWAIVLVACSAPAPPEGIAAAGGAPPRNPLEAGPAVGEKLPPFEAPDQDGRLRTFENLRGPRGLVLNFNRSVDW